MTRREILIAIIDSNTLMFNLVGTIDYKLNAMKAWNELKELNKHYLAA